MSDIKGLAGLVPPEAVGEDLCHASRTASGGLPVSLGIPWLVAASLQASHGILPVCPNFPFL